MIFTAVLTVVCVVLIAAHSTLSTGFQDVPDVDNYIAPARKASPREASHLCAPDGSGVTLVEYNALSYMAYATAQDANSTATAYPFFTSLLASYGWTIVCFNTTETLLHYIVAKNERQRLVAVAFPGTASLIDAAHDLQLFVEGAVPTMATSAPPLFTDQTLSWVSYKLSSFGSRAFPQNPFCLSDDGRNVVAATIAAFPGYDVVLAGHSLSGGIANVVWSKVEVRSVGVCQPRTFLVGHNNEVCKQTISLMTTSSSRSATTSPPSVKTVATSSPSRATEIRSAAT